MWDHTVLPATRHKRTHPLNSSQWRLVLDLPAPEEWKAELTCALITPRPGVEPTTAGSEVQRPNRCATKTVTSVTIRLLGLSFCSTALCMFFSFLSHVFLRLINDTVLSRKFIPQFQRSIQYCVITAIGNAPLYTSLCIEKRKCVDSRFIRSVDLTPQGGASIALNPYAQRWAVGVVSNAA